MEQHQFDIMQIEKLVLDNAKRKDRLRRQNSRKLLFFAVALLCLFLALYQI